MGLDIKENYSDADYQRLSNYVRTLCEYLICIAFESQLITCKSYIKNERIFSYRQENFSQLKSSEKKKASWKSIIEDFNNLFHEHEEVKRTIPIVGGSTYMEWYLKRFEEIYRISDEVGFLSDIDCDDEDLALSLGIKETFLCIINKAIDANIHAFNWETIYERFPRAHGNLDKQIVTFSRVARDKIATLLLSESTDFSEFKLNLKKRMQDLRSEIKDIEDDLSKPAVLVMRNLDQDDINLKTLAATTEGWPITKHNQLRAKLLDKRYNKTTTIDLNELIANPLPWLELKSVLQNLQCVSELQTRLRIVLLDFIQQCEINPDATEARAQVEYLINAMTLAKRFVADDVYLLKKSSTHSTSATHSAGIYYIMENAEKSNTVTNNILLPQLKDLIMKVNLGFTLYTQAVRKNDMSLTKLIEASKNRSGSHYYQLFWKYINRYETQIIKRVDSQALNDLNKAIYFLCEAAKMNHPLANSKLLTFSEPLLTYEYNNKFVSEMLHRLEALRSITPKTAIIEQMLKKLRQSLIQKEYQTTISNDVACKNNYHHISLNSKNIMQALLDNQDVELVYNDPTTGIEVARIRLAKGILTLFGYGNNIDLSFDGPLSLERIIDENGAGNTILNGTFKSKNLYIASQSKTLLLNTSIATEGAVLLESKGMMSFAETAILRAKQISIRSDYLQCGGNLVADTSVNLKIKKAFAQGVASIISGGMAVVLEAENIPAISGRILSKGVVSLKSVEEIEINSDSSIAAGTDLFLHANSIVAKDNSSFSSKRNARIIVKDEIIIKDHSDWDISNLELNANIIDNSSPNLEFTSATFIVKDKFVNRADGVIETKEALNLRGENVWNRGIINYGKKLNATLNKVFVNGLEDINHIVDPRAAASNRACIVGEDANITTSVYLNLASLLKTRALSLTSIAEIQLGVTVPVSKNTSSLIKIAYDLDVPNFSGIFNEVKNLFHHVLSGEFKTAYTQLAESNLFTKATSLLRGLLASKPIDLIWTLGQLILRLPHIKKQIDMLSMQQTKIQMHQYVTLTTGFSNVATQLKYFENEAVHLDSYDIHGSMPTLFDSATLALPYDSNSSALEFQGGLQAHFTSLDRSFFSEFIYDVELGFNETHLFEEADSQHDVNVAYRNSSIGGSLSRSGVLVAHQDYTNTTSEINAGTSAVDEIIAQSDHLTFTKDSHIQAKQMTVIAKEADLKGQSHIAAAVIQTSHHAGIEGHQQFGSLDVNSKQDIAIAGHVEANTLHAFARNISTQGQLEAGEALFMSSHRLEMRGIVTGNTLVTIAEFEENSADVNEEDFEANAGYYTSTGHTTARHEKIRAENIETNGVDDSSVIEEQAEKILDADAELTNADGVAFLSAHEVNAHGAAHITTFAVTANFGSVEHANVKNLAINFKDIPDVEDLLLGIGIYSDVHASKALMATTTAAVTFTKAMDLNYSVSLTVAAIDIPTDIHSSGNLAFTATNGDIHTSHNKLYAERSLLIHASNSYINEQGFDFGTEIVVQVGYDITNNGTIAASNYLSMDAGHDILNNYIARDVQGKYDILKEYQQGRIVGGVGINHDGVGLSAHAGDKFVNNASIVMSGGSDNISAKNAIISIDTTHRFEDYDKYYHNKWGRSTHTVEYDYQQLRPVFYSQNGSNNFTSSNGDFYSRSTQFYGEQGNNVHTKNNSEFLGSVLEKECIKSKSNLYGLSRSHSDVKDERDVPTEIVSLGNDTIVSDRGRVDLRDVYVQTPGLLTLKAKNVLVSQDILNHSQTETFTGLTIDCPIAHILDAQHPIVQDYHALQNSHGSVEWSANTWNSLVDATRFINNMASGALFSAFFPSANLEPIEIGFTQSRTCAKWQSTPNNTGIFVGGLSVTGTNDVTFDNGVTVDVHGKTVIHTPVFNEFSAELNNSQNSYSLKADVGVDFAFKPVYSASASFNSQQQVLHQNVHFNSSEADLYVDVMTMRGANNKFGTLNGTVRDLYTISETNTSSGESASLSMSSGGTGGAQHSQSSSARIGEVSGMDIGKDNLTIDKANLKSGYIRSVQPGAAHINSLETSSIEEFESGTAVGLSASKQTVTPSLGRRDFQATQDSTVSGVDLGGTPINGPLNQTTGKGERVSVDENLNVQLKIPTDTGKELEKLGNNFQHFAQVLTKPPEVVNPIVPTEKFALPPIARTKTDFGSNWAAQKSEHYAHSIFTPVKPTALVEEPATQSTTSKNVPSSNGSSNSEIPDNPEPVCYVVQKNKPLSSADFTSHPFESLSQHLNETFNKPLNEDDLKGTHCYMLEPDKVLAATDAVMGKNAFYLPTFYEALQTTITLMKDSPNFPYVAGTVMLVTGGFGIYAAFCADVSVLTFVLTFRIIDKAVSDLDKALFILEYTPLAIRGIELASSLKLIGDGSITLITRRDQGNNLDVIPVDLGLHLDVVQAFAGIFNLTEAFEFELLNGAAIINNLKIEKLMYHSSNSLYDFSQAFKANNNEATVPNPYINLEIDNSRFSFFQSRNMKAIQTSSLNVESSFGKRYQL